MFDTRFRQYLLPSIVTSKRLFHFSIPSFTIYSLYILISLTWSTEFATTLFTFTAEITTGAAASPATNWRGRVTTLTGIVWITTSFSWNDIFKDLGWSYLPQSVSPLTQRRSLEDRILGESALIRRCPLVVMLTTRLLITRRDKTARRMRKANMIVTFAVLGRTLERMYWFRMPETAKLTETITFAPFYMKMCGDQVSRTSARRYDVILLRYRLDESGYINRTTNRVEYFRSAQSSRNMKHGNDIVFLWRFEENYPIHLFPLHILRLLLWIKFWPE